jgi:hypothetical protein
LLGLSLVMGLLLCHAVLVYPLGIHLVGGLALYCTVGEVPRDTWRWVASLVVMLVLVLLLAVLLVRVRKLHLAELARIAPLLLLFHTRNLHLEMSQRVLHLDVSSRWGGLRV